MIRLLFLLLLVNISVFAKCKPCVCTESSSCGQSSSYLSSQSSVLEGYIVPDVQEAIARAKDAVKTTEGTLYTLNERRAGEIIVLNEYKKNIYLLKKIENKVLINVLSKINEARSIADKAELLLLGK